MFAGTGQEEGSWLWLYYFGQSEKMILLFGVGRDYEFIDEEKESGGTGVIRSDDAPLIFDSVY